MKFYFKDNVKPAHSVGHSQLRSLDTDNLFKITSSVDEKMAMENRLYAQVVIIHRRESDDKKEKDKTKIYIFQGQQERTKHLFDFDHEWLKENFMTCEPDFYKKYIKLN